MIRRITIALALFLSLSSIAQGGGIGWDAAALKVNSSGQCTKALDTAGTYPFWRVTCPYSAGNKRQFEFDYQWPNEAGSSWQVIIQEAHAVAGNACWEIESSVDMTGASGTPTAPNFQLATTLTYAVSAGQVGEAIYHTSSAFTPTRSDTGAVCSSIECKDFMIHFRVSRDMTGACTSVSTGSSIVYTAIAVHD